MNYRRQLFYLFAYSMMAVAAVEAAPAPKELPGTPITVENAHKLRVSFEVEKSAYRIKRIPKTDELIIFDFNKSAEVVEDRTLKPVRVLAKDKQPSDITVSADGQFVTWHQRGSKSYTVQQTKDGKTFEIEIGEHPGFAAFSPDSQMLAIGFSYWDPKVEGVGYSEMKLFDIKGKLLRTLERTGPGALWPVFSPDGKVLAVGNRNHETQIFDVGTGKLLHKLNKRMTQEIAFSPDGKFLATGYVDGHVGIWEVASGKQVYLAPSGCEEVYSVDWSPKGDLLVTSGNKGKIVVWDSKKMTKLVELDSPSWVIQVKFTADGARLMSAGSASNTGRLQRTITVWSVPK